jgi:hypothetical protein
MKNKVSITTIIMAVTLSKLYAKGCDNDVLVEVIAEFRECLWRDQKAKCKCDITLIQLARAIRADFGYLVDVV